MRFLGYPLIKHIPGATNSYIVTRGFSVEIDDGCVIRVGSGWETDGASVPRWLWWCCPPMSGAYMEAAVLHDALYRTQRLPRAKADKIFLDAMASLGTPRAKRYAIYSAVRAFGWIAWKQNSGLPVAERPNMEVIGCDDMR